MVVMAVRWIKQGGLSTTSLKAEMPFSLKIPAIATGFTSLKMQHTLYRVTDDYTL